MPELDKSYTPAEVEARWYQRWLDDKCFEADPARVSEKRPAYSIVIPPPNVTGILTLGHVLNNTIQDILARRARMLGKEVLWLPGTDHAGIATQNVVEKTLKKQGVIKHRDDLGREGLVAKIWEWKEKHGGIIIEQLKKLGASCDWSRERFTFDDDYNACVMRVFVDLYKKGLIYRGKRMVNWCPSSLTALSDEEVVMKAQNAIMYHFKVEVVEEPGTWLTIATTRPEVIPGDTAIAVNPKDERYAHLIGKHVRRPLPVEDQALLPIIADEHVDFTFGTGVLKVTPAHDKADFEIWTRIRYQGRVQHIAELADMQPIDVMHPNGVLNELAGKDLAGMERFAARKRAAELLAEIGSLVKEEPYQNNLGYSERADVPIESRLSEQWFLKYPSVKEARECVAQEGSARVSRAEVGVPPGSVPGADDTLERHSAGTRNAAREDACAPSMRFHPDRWAKVYDHWMTGLQDWCISRQVWWGHRVPVWHRKSTQGSWEECLPGLFGARIPTTTDMHSAEGFETSLSQQEGHTTVFQSYPIGTQEETYAATTSEVEAAILEKAGFTQDPDVLDTWFSSWLWPFATMGWPEKTSTLKAFYPTTDLVTGPDIIFFWVARMIMAGFEWMGELPFKNVYFTGIIRDKQGRKMSKSLGNSPDPLELIASYSADALRFGIMRSAPLGQDICFDDKNVELGRNFCTKLWNAARFRQMQGGEVCADIVLDCLSVFDRAILKELERLIRNVNIGYDIYDFSLIASALYEFFWKEFCDWYLEAAKAALTGKDENQKKAALAVIDKILSVLLRLLHPFIPFVTEELWHGMGYSKNGGSIMFEAWPSSSELPYIWTLNDPDEISARGRYTVATVGRTLKSNYNIAASKRTRFVLKPNATLSQHEIEVIKVLLCAEPLEVDPNYTGAQGAWTPVGDLFMPLDGLIDVEAERARIGKEAAKVESELEKVSAKLADTNFTSKVPQKVLDEHQQRKTDWQEKLAKLKVMLEALG
ncbi:MAG: valine--tRNA ligase [Verrucomicrobiaceae bacterium]|nr:valine--tRNA ligase [Verrucomicrobiaceae bacterium]